MSKLNDNLRKIYLFYKRKKLNNTTFSLISSNCNGGIIYHDLGLQFTSPTINLWIPPKDFINFCKYLREYINTELLFDNELSKINNYPVGILKPENPSLPIIHIYFMHYNSNKNAKEKWDTRKKRINYDNLYILFNDMNDCSLENLQDFDSLPYINKVVFTNKPYANIKSSFYIKGFENEKSIGLLTKHRNKFTPKRIYDDFPYVKWFNNTI